MNQQTHTHTLQSNVLAIIVIKIQTNLIDNAQFSIKSTALQYILAVTSMTFYHITKTLFSVYYNQY